MSDEAARIAKELRRDAFFRSMRNVRSWKCVFLGHRFSMLSIYHDEGQPLYECRRCGQVNA